MGFDSKKIGNRIAELRKTLKHVSQEKMAEDLGMYQPDISALENGKLGSGIADLNKLSLVADYLGVSLNRILGCCEEDTSVIMKSHLDNISGLIGEDHEYNNLKIFESGLYATYLMEEPLSPQEVDLSLLRTFIFYGDRMISYMTTVINR